MADDAATPDEPRPCDPCRGTGQVISNLGGSPSTVTCPWCDGTGVFAPGHDAQAARRGDAPANPQAEPEVEPG
jgi:DnaJ-class molecular chaperone